MRLVGGRKGKDEAADYFLAGRNLGWWVIGASIFASNIGSEHIVGLAGSGAKDGVALAHYELHAWCLLVLAWVFVPFYARSLVFTMPEFLERRFSTPSRYVLSIVSLVTFIVSKIAVGIFAGGVVFGTLLPEMHVVLLGHDFDSFWVGSVLVVVLTGLYTMLGGMRAVAYNDAVQVIVLIGGSALLTIYGLVQLGGWGELQAPVRLGHVQLMEAAHSQGRGIFLGARAGEERQRATSSRRRGISTAISRGWAWPSARRSSDCGIGVPINTLCNGRLGAPNEQTARRGSIFAAFLKLFPVYLFIIPGLICFALAKSGKVPGLAPVYDPQTGHATAAAAQGAFPLMVAHLLPAGLRGIVVAGLAFGADGFAGGSVQRLLDTFHGGHLRETAAQGLAA